jgi:hypothetical protein
VEDDAIGRQPAGGFERFEDMPGGVGGDGGIFGGEVDVVGAWTLSLMPWSRAASPMARAVSSRMVTPRLHWYS